MVGELRGRGDSTSFRDEYSRRSAEALTPPAQRREGDSVKNDAAKYLMLAAWLESNHFDIIVK